MSKLLTLAVVVVALAGCAAPNTTHQAGPATPGSPAGSVSPTAATSGPGGPPAGKSTTTKPPTKPSSASASAPGHGGVTYDPFDSPQCTWVPRMFVDLSGKARPGMRVRMSLWATGLTGPVTSTVRGELNGPDRHPTTETVTTNTTPEWRGTTSLAMAVPASGDLFSVAITFDVDHKVSTISGHTGVEATLPSPRPTADTNLPCTRVT